MEAIIMWFHKICYLLLVKMNFIRIYRIFNHISARIFEPHTWTWFFPQVCRVKFLFIRIRYHNLTKVTYASQYNGHNIVQFKAFIESYNIIASNVINCTIFCSLWLSWHPFVFMIQSITFMFSYANINHNVWVECFLWRSIRELAWRCAWI